VPQLRYQWQGGSQQLAFGNHSAPYTLPKIHQQEIGSLGVSGQVTQSQGPDFLKQQDREFPNLGHQVVIDAFSSQCRFGENTTAPVTSSTIPGTLTRVPQKPFVSNDSFRSCRCHSSGDPGVGKDWAQRSSAWQATGSALTRVSEIPISTANEAVTDRIQVEHLPGASKARRKFRENIQV
jgi:hypothetical protein